MNHAFIRPGGVAQDLPAGALERIREYLAIMPHQLGEVRALADASPAYLARTKNIAYLDLAGCMSLGVTGPVLRATGLPWDLRKSQPYCGYETYDFDVPVETGCDVYGRYLIRMAECDQSLRIVEQCVERLQRSRPADDPVMIGTLRSAGPRSWHSARTGGQLARPHRAHHEPVHGGAHPPLQAGHRGFRVRSARPTRRSSRPAASWAVTRSATAAPGPTARTSATRRSPTCSPSRPCARAAWWPT